jgi:hypothetical protein
MNALYTYVCKYITAICFGCKFFYCSSSNKITVTDHYSSSMAPMGLQWSLRVMDCQICDYKFEHDKDNTDHGCSDDELRCVASSVVVVASSLL